jgi:hypothetical protein
MVKKVNKTMARISEEISDPEVSSEPLIDDAKIEMKEVLFDATKFLVAKASNLSAEAQSLIDKMKGEAEELLKKLSADKKISEFRIAPIGATLTQDYKADRITALTDHTGKVVDAYQG